MNNNLSQHITILVKEHEVPLIRYCYSITRNREQAKDIVQDAFIKLINALKKGDVLQNEKAWLYKVCHNIALDYLRKMKRTNEKSSIVQEVFDQQKLNDKPDTVLIDREMNSLVNKSLLNLNDREQQIINLKIRKNYSYQQIAAEMNLSSTNVGFILHQAFKKLAADFKQHHNEVHS